MATARLPWYFTGIFGDYQDLGLPAKNSQFRVKGGSDLDQDRAGSRASSRLGASTPSPTGRVSSPSRAPPPRPSLQLTSPSLANKIVYVSPSSFSLICPFLFYLKNVEYTSYEYESYTISATRSLQISGQPGLPTLRMQLQPGTCPFTVLRFWGKMPMPNAGNMAYRRDFPSTTSI